MFLRKANAFCWQTAVCCVASSSATNGIATKSSIEAVFGISKQTQVKVRELFLLQKKRTKKANQSVSDAPCFLTIHAHWTYTWITQLFMQLNPRLGQCKLLVYTKSSYALVGLQRENDEREYDVLRVPRARRTH